MVYTLAVILVSAPSLRSNMFFYPSSPLVNGINGIQI